MRSQRVFMNRFFKENYGLSIKSPKQEERIIEKGLLEKYSEDRDEEGLTPSERFELAYFNKFLRPKKFVTTQKDNRKFNIPQRYNKWAEEIEQDVEEIEKSLEGRKHRKSVLENIVNIKAA